MAEGEYKERLELAKTYVMDDILTGYPNASFVDYERELQGKGFVKEIEPTDIAINEKLSHLIMWNTTNQFVIDTINELKVEGRIKLEPVPVLAYEMDGEILKIPPRYWKESHANSNLSEVD